MIDDPTLLTAYLDDELVPEDRRQVAAALRGDPEAARLLRELAGVRDLVAGLDRPAAPADVPMAVVLRIDRQRSVKQLLLLATTLSAAAATVLALLLPIPGLWGPNAGPNGGQLVAQHDPPARPSPVDEGTKPPDDEEAPETLLAGPTRASDPDFATPSAVELARDLDRGRYHRLFRNRDAWRFVIPVDRLDTPTIDAVDRIVHNSVLHSPAFSLVRVPAGLAIDDRHPGDAAVFVLNLAPHEADRLLERIAAAEVSSQEVAESPTPAGMLSQLAALDTFELGEGIHGSLLLASPAAADPFLGGGVLSFLKPPAPRDLEPFAPPAETNAGPRQPAAGARNPQGIAHAAEPARPDQTILLWLVETPPAR